MKRIIAVLLTMIIMISNLQLAVFASEESENEQYIYIEESTLTTEERYEGYITQLFYGNPVSFLNSTAGERLLSSEKEFYDTLVPYIREIANGERSSSIITVKNANISFDAISRVIQAIRADFPYEIYWMDNSYMYSQSGRETSVYLTVAPTYRGADEYTANTALTGVASKALNNAKDIIKKYSSKGDYEKLLGYKKEICDLVEYNYDAAYDPYYHYYDSNPWALIYVFDGDRSTNVVCEGYSKAFKYLCDNTNFAGEIMCNLVTGDNHMWNIVSVNEKNYLVDVTNSEPGTIGSGGGLFMAGGYGNIYDGYTINLPYFSYHFNYYPETIEMWGTDDDSILRLSETNFDPNTYVPRKNTCKNGHTPANSVKENIVPAKCETPGSYDEVIYCSVAECKAEISRINNPIAATGHSFGDYISNGDGTKTKECSVCHDKQTVNEIIGNEVVRIKGSDRYATSIAIANATKEAQGVDKFNTIIIASGRKFADALAGSYLAKVKEAPILMAKGDAANNALLKEYITANLVQGGTIYILGGEAAVPRTTEEALAGFNVKRLKGSDRYGTNLAILKEAEVRDEDILVATGKNFADSLSASAVGKPILLVNGTRTLSAEQKAYLETLDTDKFYIIGGEGAVNAEYATSLSEYGSVERIKGANRYGTSVAVAEKFFENPESAVLAYSHKYPDGLCGGPLAMAMDAPLILTRPNYQSVAKEYVQDKGITFGTVLGGTTLIDDATAMDIFNAKFVSLYE